MRYGRPLLSLLLLAAALPGDVSDPAREVKIPLAPVASSAKVQLGYSRPREVEVERTVPRFLFDVPKLRAPDPLFFRVALGETAGVPFYGALDRSLGGIYHDRLYLDRNRDLDLTNDGKPYEARVRTLWSQEGKLVEFLGIRLDLPYRSDGKQFTEAYTCAIYYVLSGKGGAKVPARLEVERDGWRQGTLELGGRAYTLALVDDDSDGQFSTGDSWVLRPADAPPAGMLHRDAVRTMLYPAWSEDQKWTVEMKAVDVAGRTATVRIRPAKETERDYFGRIYRQRQSPEERKLKLDPLRPKADPKEKVDWIAGKDVKYALEIAASPRVRKPVLLDFSSPTCRWCALMYRYTFTDREVYQLTRRFVCAKIAFKQGAPDTVKYKVEGTPTYIILNLDGVEIGRHAGFMRPAEFAAWLKSMLR